MAAGGNVKETSAVDLSALLDGGEGAVVTLVAGETVLAGHRAVLAARSPVFEAMFRHDTRETSSCMVAIEDVEGPVLRQLLAYCYTLQAPQLAGMADRMLAAADKYGLLALKAQCEQSVAQRLTVETAAAAAVLAVRHSCPSLKQAVAGFIRAHTSQVLHTQGWADALVGNPDLAVELTRLIAETPAKVRTAATSGGNTAKQVIAKQVIARTFGPTGTRDAPSPGVASAHQHCTLSAEQKDGKLLQAAQEGAVGEVQSLLAAGADVGAMDGDRWTALHWAAAKGHAEVARCLLGCGADAEARDAWRATPLVLAADYGRLAVVRLLAESAADVDARDAYGKTPLHHAASRGHAQVAEALLRAGAHRCPRTDSGLTPLELANRLYGINPQVVQLLTKDWTHKVRR